MYNQNKRKATKKWRENHKEKWDAYIQQYRKEHKKEGQTRGKVFRDAHPHYSRDYYKARRLDGYTRVCTKNYHLIENYELAKADNFDSNKWHLHHRLENYYSRETLKKKGLYDNVNPEALIWLPAFEHNSDKSIAIFNPEKSKWHKRQLEIIIP